MGRHLLRPGLLAAWLLAGCSSPPPPAPPVLDLAVSGGADQNPDTIGKPAPVAVHLFELSGTARFERADVFALIEREQQTLGTDELASEEFVLSPGESRVLTRQLKKDTQFIGIAVLFRDIDRATWRQMAPVASAGPSQLKLSTSGIIAKLAPAPEP
jgi:type VI secretion system protein VasD